MLVTFAFFRPISSLFSIAATLLACSCSLPSSFLCFPLPGSCCLLSHHVLPLADCNVFSVALPLPSAGSADIYIYIICIYTPQYTQVYRYQHLLERYPAMDRARLRRKMGSKVMAVAVARTCFFETFHGLCGTLVYFSSRDLARNARLWLKSLKPSTRQAFAHMNFTFKLPVPRRDAPIGGLRAIQTRIAVSFSQVIVIVPQLKWLAQWQLLVPACNLH